MGPQFETLLLSRGLLAPDFQAPWRQCGTGQRHAQWGDKTALKSVLSACSFQVTAPVSLGVKTGLTATSQSYKDEMCDERTLKLYKPQ